VAGIAVGPEESGSKIEPATPAKQKGKFGEQTKSSQDIVLLPFMGGGWKRKDRMRLMNDSPEMGSTDYYERRWTRAIYRRQLSKRWENKKCNREDKKREKEHS